MCVCVCVCMCMCVCLCLCVCAINELSFSLTSSRNFDAVHVFMRWMSLRCIAIRTHQAMLQIGGFTKWILAEKTDNGLSVIDISLVTSSRWYRLFFATRYRGYWTRSLMTGVMGLVLVVPFVLLVLYLSCLNQTNCALSPLAREPFT